MQETSYWSFFSEDKNKVQSRTELTEKFSILVYCAIRVCLTFALWRVCIVRVWLWNTVSMCILASSTAAENFPFTFSKQNQTFTLNSNQNKNYISFIPFLVFSFLVTFGQELTKVQKGKTEKNGEKISQLKWPKYQKPKYKNMGWTKHL